MCLIHINDIYIKRWTHCLSVEIQKVEELCKADLLSSYCVKPSTCVVKLSEKQASGAWGVTLPGPNVIPHAPAAVPFAVCNQEASHLGRLGMNSNILCAVTGKL